MRCTLAVSKSSRNIDAPLRSRNWYRIAPIRHFLINIFMKCVRFELMETSNRPLLSGSTNSRFHCFGAKLRRSAIAASQWKPSINQTHRGREGGLKIPIFAGSPLWMALIPFYVYIIIWVSETRKLCSFCLSNQLSGVKIYFKIASYFHKKNFQNSEPKI